MKYLHEYKCHLPGKMVVVVVGMQTPCLMCGAGRTCGWRPRCSSRSLSRHNHTSSHDWAHQYICHTKAGSHLVRMVLGLSPECWQQPSHSARREVGSHMFLSSYSGCVASYDGLCLTAHHHHPTWRHCCVAAWAHVGNYVGVITWIQ